MNPEQTVEEIAERIVSSWFDESNDGAVYLDLKKCISEALTLERNARLEAETKLSQAMKVVEAARPFASMLGTGGNWKDALIESLHSFDEAVK